MQTRQDREQQWHDGVTQQETRGGFFYRWGLSRSSRLYAWSQLGELEGRSILEIGSGDGGVLMKLGSLAKKVVGVDVSGEMVRLANERAVRNGLTNVTAVHSPAEGLPFADNSFDLVYGVSILHHLDLEPAIAEVHRVLRPGGRAVFLEPRGTNPLISAFRVLTPWRRTPDERPLTPEHVNLIVRPFSRSEAVDFHLLTLFAILVPIRPLFRLAVSILDPIDRLVLRAGFLKPFAWIVVLSLEK